MAIDGKSRIGKMIDKDRVVYHCLRCGMDLIGDANTDTHYCPKCNSREDTILLVIVGNFLVRK